MYQTHGSNKDLKPTKASVEMDCATGVHMTRSGGDINGSDRGLETHVYAK